MEQDYQTQRGLCLRQAQQMIEAANFDPSAICMQHHVRDTQRIAGLCIGAAREMAASLGSAIDRLENGGALAEICDPQALPHFKPVALPDTAAGGAASALCDLAALIVAIDPEPFASTATGDVRKDVVSFLNGTLHGWLLELREQWNALKPQIAAGPSLFDAPIPAPDGEKATLGTVYRALRQCFRIGPEAPSPYESAAAQAFADLFSVKLWPGGDAAEIPASGRECILNEVSTAFQAWYFTVGKTQIPANTQAAKRQAEDVFVDLRHQFHDRVRACLKESGGACGKPCVQDSLAPVAEGPFKDRCRTAVNHIVWQMKRGEGPQI